jgi:hypothetical protein
MSKETTAGSSQGGLVYLKYTFRYKDQFDKPNDDWLKCVDATSDELLGAYTRAEDDALTLAFGGRGKKRLNIVFDVIGFVYPDYIFPSRKQGKKRKTAASAISVMPKGKKIKVLTYWPRYIETAVVPKFGEGTSSTVEAAQAAPASRSAKESTAVPKVSATGSAKVMIQTAEAEGKTVEMPDREETVGPSEPELPKVAKTLAITPTRRRMASVLDAVMETTRALMEATITPAKKVAEAVRRLVLKPKLSPQCPRRQSLLQLRELSKNVQILAWLWRRIHSKKLNLLFPKHRPKILTLLSDMLREKDYLKKKLQKRDTTPGN